MSMNKTEMILKAYKEDKHFNRGEFSEEHDINRCFISEVIGRYKKSAGFKNKVKFHGADPGSEKESKQMAKITETMDSIQVETQGKDIRTADGALEYCGVDTDKWVITKKIVNFWDQSKDQRNWQVKVWLSPKEADSVEETIERLMERMPKFKYSKFEPKSIASKWGKSGNMAVIANLDAHLGKLAWDAETGQGDYDLDIACDDYNHVTDVNLQRCAMFRPEKIMFILGQDMMHVENMEGVTPKGKNVLDTDTRLPKLQDAAIDITIQSILKCRSVAPVEVILVQGNHDQTSSLWLAKVIKAWFKDDKHVEVDDTPRLRKARRWGTSFIGMAHEVMPSKMPFQVAEFAVQFKEDWAKCEYRECLFGHKHKKQEYRVGSQATHGTMLFRQLTALSPIDFWHYENLFVDAVPGGEALVYNKNTGCIASFTEWTYHKK